MSNGGKGPVWLKGPHIERDPDQWAKIEPIVGETFSVALELGGTLSGEHGVGTLTR